MSGLNVDYMAYPPIADLEAKIKAGSHEDAVDDMWINVAPLYFRLADGFTMKAQSRLRATSGQKSDIGVRKFVNRNAKKYQLTAYLGQMRVGEPDFKKTLFAVITIGKASQFFSFPYNQSKLQCLHDESEAYTFKQHQADVDRWMVYMREEILAGN